MTVPKLESEQCSVHLHKYSIFSPVCIWYQVFRWPIRYPAARGRHNCKFLHYCLCVRNDGAQAGSGAVSSTSSQVFNIITSMYHLVSSTSLANRNIKLLQGGTTIVESCFIAFACKMTVPKLEPEQSSVRIHKNLIVCILLVSSIPLKI